MDDRYWRYTLRRRLKHTTGCMEIGRKGQGEEKIVDRSAGIKRVEPRKNSVHVKIIVLLMMIDRERNEITGVDG